jgi:uncharacterized membrane protein YraQ (UPF0718 family)
MKRFMDTNLVILLLITLALSFLVLLRQPALFKNAVWASGKLFGGVWVELAIGFILAGLLEVLIPAPVLLRWMGSESSGQGILVGSVVGLLLPGGPYLIFPIVADLLRQGAAPGPLIALLTAKVLLSPIRMLTYEAPLLGWPMTLARLLPGLLLPPVLGLVGQWLFAVFNRK